MKIDYTKFANVVNVPVRIGLGLGCGLFTRQVCKNVTSGMSTPAKVATWAAAFCTTWALGHATDCWCNEAIDTLLEYQKFQDTIKEDLDEMA